MRFAWKVTLASLCILVLSIGMGSHLLISISFRSTLNREIAVAQEEMQMLRIAYESSGRPGSGSPGRRRGW